MMISSSIAAKPLSPLPTPPSFVLHHLPLPINSPFSPSTSSLKNPWQCGRSLLNPPRAAVISSKADGSFDPELRLVLELANDFELYEIARILFGPSYFSPLLKSLTNRADVDVMDCEDFCGRKDFIEHLESRFLFLAADARSTLRGWRPTYRNVLLDVRRKLSVPCTSKLSTEDLEAEIFLHLLQEFSSEESGGIPFLPERFIDDTSHHRLAAGPDHWKMRVLSILKVGMEELRSIILKGGGVLTLAKIYQLIAKRLFGKVLSEAANYQIKREFIQKGGELAVVNLESRTALLAASKGLACATSRYLGLRSLMMLLGPMLWGTFLADIVIQMIGTDYARILQAIYAFAQIRLTKTYGWTLDKNKLS